MLKKLLLFLSLLYLPALADTASEINHLLNYIEKTDCQYIRNGDVHNGVDAEKHIRKKYDYFKDEIKSTEDFIRLSATKSTMFGNKYYIQCKGSPKIESSKWLLKELKRYRSK